MKESTFWNTIKPLFKGMDAQRVEVTSGRGIPDVNLCHNGREFWIELKVAFRGTFYLRKEQYVWGMRRAHVGGYVFIVGYDDGEYWVWRYPTVEIVRGGKYFILTRAMAHRVETKIEILNILFSLLR